MRPRKVTDLALLEITRVARERDKIPSDKELAYRFDISCSTIKALMNRVRVELSSKMSILTVSRETESDTIARE